MTYSIIGILAVIMMLTINGDVLLKRPDDLSSTYHRYRAFLLGVSIYYITDALWGILDEVHLTQLQYADTVIYFIAMVSAVLLWTRFVVSYLEDSSVFGKALSYAGLIFFALSVVVIVINLFVPVVFWFDASGAYHAEFARYALLFVQIAMFLLTSIYTLHTTSKTQGTKKRRYLTIGLFGIAMIALIALQIAYPLLPFYAMGYLLGTSVLHTFVVEDEREERRQELEQALERERKQGKELDEGRRALAEALAAAERASRAKTTFLNNMSHDIRTPMNAIVGFAALASSHADNAEQVKDYLGKIEVSSQHLLSLINDVLDMSRIESGKVTIEEADVHLPDLIHDLAMIVQANVSEKSQELFIDVHGIEHEDVITDRLRLNQVLLNILSNAIKFTPEGGSIAFQILEKPSTRPDYAEFEFRIKDNGIGMSEEFQLTVFEAFSRERTSTVSGIQGTGLGMAITKNIVDMMGGMISVESKEGEGSEFIVELPCRIASEPIAYGPIPELRDVRALVVDDDENSRISVQSILEDFGMHADCASSGAEAIASAKEACEQGNPYREFIIDWIMPGLDGIETARRIREFAKDAPRIILTTAYDWTDAAEKAKAAGVTTFCSKPVFSSELHRLLIDFDGESSAALIEGARMSFEGKRILLAEDNEMNQMIALAILEGNGFSVDVALDGRQALEKMIAAPAGYYDAILMDIQMPNMDGHEAARAIRSLDDEEKARVPIIAVTANAFKEDRIFALEAGMDGHLAKPYDIPAIMETLAKVLAR